ncbi:MAG TPA: TonB family protein [Terriglobales bacterium]
MKNGESNIRGKEARDRGNLIGPINIAGARRQKAALWASVGLHVALLAWLIHSPKAIFVSPTWVRQGRGGTSLAHIYFEGNPDVGRAHLPSRVYLEPNKETAKNNSRPKPDSKYKTDGKRDEALLLPNQRPAGAPYGSLSYGTISGPDVRAAIPEVFPDPAFSAAEQAEAAGDVIVEVTIDDQGNVAETRLVQGLSPYIDQKVLATIGRWRFLPATRNSVPMASKQDIYYHFPR